MARDCPNCGTTAERGDARCQHCGEPLAIGPLGETSSKPLLWGGRLLAAAALIVPAAALGGAVLGLSLWIVHDELHDAAQTMVAALVLGVVGYATRGGFILL